MFIQRGRVVVVVVETQLGGGGGEGHESDRPVQTTNSVDIKTSAALRVGWLIVFANGTSITRTAHSEAEAKKWEGPSRRDKKRITKERKNERRRRR